jgi:hypothetical protein
MNQLPFYIPAVFILASFFAIFIFFRASGKPVVVLIVLITWLALQSAIALTGFFAVTDTLPPRFIFLIGIPLIAMTILFSTAKGKIFVDSFNVGQLTLLHSIRIAVELVLFWLFLQKTMPRLMTIEGRNFDLVSGVTAPLVYYFGFVKRKLGVGPMLAWNFICLFILLFTVSNAVLSAPTPLQKFGFGQPTIAVFYFPFVWLPGVVVPVVIFSHLITIRSLIQRIKSKSFSAYAGQQAIQ